MKKKTKELKKSALSQNKSKNECKSKTMQTIERISNQVKKNRNVFAEERQYIQKLKNQFNGANAHTVHYDCLFYFSGIKCFNEMQFGGISHFVDCSIDGS